jgi:NAD(P)-dependent dehydrogenase (short-subunit alcohol dehydrogenase family)
MNLKGKVVLVTGSSSGIGKETAIRFAQKGCNVIITYNTEREEGEDVLNACLKYGDAILLYLDVTDDRSIDQAVKAVEGFGKIDILVNNAGIMRMGNLVLKSAEDITTEVHTNLLGLIKVTRAFLPYFYRQKEGVIINIASGAGKSGYSRLSVYCATKFGVRGFTQALAAELPVGIRVYCVNPGTTATRMTDYQGKNPKKVAEIIVLAAEEKLNKKSGDDIDVWNYLR